MVMQIAPVVNTAPRASRAVVLEDGQPTRVLNLQRPRTVGDVYAEFHAANINVSVSLAYGADVFTIRINGVAIHENNSITA